MSAKIYLIFAGALIFLGCRTYYQHGVEDAQRDISQNYFKLCRIGENVKFEDEIAQIFLIQYNVEWFHYPQQDLTEESIEHCKGYNSVMEQEIRDKFGDHIFKTVSDAAEELYTYRNQPIPENVLESSQVDTTQNP